jgi:hypothetical protein
MSAGASPRSPEQSTRKAVEGHRALARKSSGRSRSPVWRGLRASRADRRPSFGARSSGERKAPTVIRSAEPRLARCPATGAQRAAILRAPAAEPPARARQATVPSAHVPPAAGIGEIRRPALLVGLRRGRCPRALAGQSGSADPPRRAIWGDSGNAPPSTHGCARPSFDATDRASLGATPRVEPLPPDVPLAMKSPKGALRHRRPERAPPTLAATISGKPRNGPRVAAGFQGCREDARRQRGRAAGQPSARSGANNPREGGEPGTMRLRVPAAMQGCAGLPGGSGHRRCVREGRGALRRRVRDRAGRSAARRRGGRSRSRSRYRSGSAARSRARVRRHR